MNISLLKSEIAERFNWPVESVRIQAISGGSINKAFCCQSISEKIFIKVNNVDPGSHMFTTEANGLKTLRSSESFRIPEIIAIGSFDQYAYLILEWIEPGIVNVDFAENFALRLSKLHSCTKDLFGFNEDNFIGSLPQRNRLHANWNEFYAQERILPITRSLYNSNSFLKKDIDQTEKLISNLENLIPKEKPALLHGDLWAGNYLTDKNGDPVLIDPAVYYGHREVDLAMMKLFGGFNDDIFHKYNELFPLEAGWKDRVLLFQLYPILVHAELFGGSYVNQAKRIIDQYN